MSWTTLRTAIESKLNTLDKLGTVKDYHTDSLDSFPAATFEPSGNSNNFITNTDNFRGYAFDIVIHQEMGNIGQDEALRILAAAVDQVIEAFDQDFQLGGASDFNLPLPSSWGEYTSGSGVVKYAQLTLVCNKEVVVISP